LGVGEGERGHVAGVRHPARIRGELREGQVVGSGEGEGCSANIEYLSVRLRISRNHAFCQRPTTKEILRRPWQLIGSRLIRLTMTRKKESRTELEKCRKIREKNRKRERESEVKSWASMEHGVRAGCVAERGQHFGDCSGGLWV